MFRLSASTPNVVRPLHVDVMTTPNGAFVPFLVLEWLEGETLDAIIRGRRAQQKPPLALAEVARLLEPVAQALDRAHHFDGPRGKETIVHCDLKPENVFVAEVGGERVVKILDFGVAKVRAATQASGTSGAGALFTPAYGAPEQWNPASLGEAGPWTDVWGLALTAVEALVGEPVISGDHQRIMKQVLDRARRPTPRTYGVVVPDAVEAVFARALAVDPRERPRDAGVFLEGDARGCRRSGSDRELDAGGRVHPGPRAGVTAASPLRSAARAPGTHSISTRSTWVRRSISTCLRASRSSAVRSRRPRSRSRRLQRSRPRSSGLPCRPAPSRRRPAHPRLSRRFCPLLPYRTVSSVPPKFSLQSGPADPAEAGSFPHPS